MTYLLILTANILFLYFLKTDKKYWLLSIPLWIGLVSGFVIWRTQSDKHIQNLEAEYWKSAENKENGDYAKWDTLKQTEKQSQAYNMTFLYCVALQTLITFICQIAGQSKTKQKFYSWTKWVFGVLLLLVFILIAMMGIVPSGGMIG